MPKASPARARLPRGTKPVMQAFFDALQAIPEHSRAEVAKAAHAGIRDALKAEREQAKEERARERSAGAGLRNAGNSKSAGTRKCRQGCNPSTETGIKIGRRSCQPARENDRQGARQRTRRRNTSRRRAERRGWRALDRG